MTKSRQPSTSLGPDFRRSANISYIRDMDYLLIILFTFAIGNCYSTLDLLWSQILLVPALGLAYSMGFGMLYKWRYRYRTEESYTFRFLFVFYCVCELIKVFDTVKSALE